MKGHSIQFIIWILALVSKLSFALIDSNNNTPNIMTQTSFCRRYGRAAMQSCRGYSKPIRSMGHRCGSGGFRGNCRLSAAAGQADGHEAAPVPHGCRHLNQGGRVLQRARSDPTMDARPCDIGGHWRHGPHQHHHGAHRHRHMHAAVWQPGQEQQQVIPSTGFDKDYTPRRVVMDYLFDHVDSMTRTMEATKDPVTGEVAGVRAVTTTSDPLVAQALQTHCQQMQDLHQVGAGIRMWDPLFAKVAQHASEMRMQVTPLPNGVQVEQTGQTPCAVALAQAHANVVSKFVMNGWEERPKAHAVPPVCMGKSSD